MRLMVVNPLIIQSLFQTIMRKGSTQQHQERFQGPLGRSEEQGNDTVSNRSIYSLQSFVNREGAKLCESRSLVDRMLKDIQTGTQLAEEGTKHQQEHRRSERALRSELALAKSKIAELRTSEIRLKERLLAAERVIMRLQRISTYHMSSVQATTRARGSALVKQPVTSSSDVTHPPSILLPMDIE